jgi:aspartyl-tRNA(Asn)/glutamyl-tRNA(Gln) amidotransferase subunit C
MAISKKEVEHIAELARLELTEEEVEKFTKQLTSVLEYVDQLKELDLPADAPEMAHAAGLENVLRDDEVQGCGEEVRKAIIDAFPHRQGDLLESAAVFTDRNENV